MGKNETREINVPYWKQSIEIADDFSSKFVLTETKEFESNSKSLGESTVQFFGFNVFLGWISVLIAIYILLCKLCHDIEIKKKIIENLRAGSED